MVKEEIQEKDKKKKLPKEISQEILKKIFKNLLRAVGIMFYFIILNLAYSTMKQERLVGDIEVFAGAFLVVGIVLLEKAYKRDDDSMGITGVECLFLALHSLSIMHVITMFQYDFRFYLLTSSYVFSIYYVLKSIILYTKGRREYLNSLSDISEIVKKEEPIKKEAKKRKEPEEKIEVEESSAKKKKTSQKTNNTKTENKTEKPKTVKKRTSKPKTQKEENQKDKTNQEEKEEQEEEVKTPEKKKRGRPKKEVKKVEK